MNLAIVDAIGDALKARLLQSGDVTSAVGDRIYYQIYPPTTAMPLLVYDLIDGTWENTSQRDSFAGKWSITCEALDRDVASLTAQSVMDCLQSLMGLPVAGFSEYWLRASKTVLIDRYVEGQRVFMRGYWFEVRADRSR